MPDDIGPVKGVNLVLGMCLLILAAVPGWPVALALYHDGLNSLFDWPVVFNWLALTTAALGGGGLSLIARPQRVGANIRFHRGGFDVHVRQFFRKDLMLNLGWSDIGEITVFKAGRRGDSLTFRAAHGRVVRVPMRLLAVRTDEVMARLRSAARVDGYGLVQTGDLNLVLIERQRWQVVAMDAVLAVP